MKNFKYIFISLIISIMLSGKALCLTSWVNDARSLFISNNAIIYALNIRTFNAKDKNKNGIIEEEQGEERGNFLNAIERLDELAAMGINTVHVLPITPTGKVKALGTAGSLYAAASFNEINPQLKSPDSKLSIEDEMRKFVDECHARKIRVIVDLPSCGSYDLYMRRPELFVKDKNQNPVIPADWTDVRLFDTGNDANLNQDVYALYQEFIDMMINLDVDGIRADVATIKPFTFWKKLIDETRMRNPEFLFLAEASPIWKKPPSEFAVFTPYNKLLEAGFDGYYGGYSEAKNWKSAQDLYSCINTDLNIQKDSKRTKSAIGSFATHDTVSPILINGPQYSTMIIWLNATLPINPYYIDGFQTGDTYIYPWANKKAAKTYTDDDYYFEHRGQLDIFNFSRRSQGKHYALLRDIVSANKLRTKVPQILSSGDFNILRTNSSSVFAYKRGDERGFFVIIGNLDFKKPQKAIVTVPKLNKDMFGIPIKISNNAPVVTNNRITVSLAQGEIQVLYFSLPQAE